MWEGNRFSWFLIRKIIEVATPRGASQSTGTAMFSLYEARQQAPFIGIGRSKFGTQSHDLERDLYDLGQDHGGTRRAAELLEYILTVNNVLNIRWKSSYAWLG